MAKKKIDQRIRTLIENNVLLGHRSFFVLIGDHGRDQVVNLHYILSKAQVARRPSVLWCYKKELGFTSHQKKRLGQLKKKKMLGNASRNDDSGSSANPFEDPFELFLSQTDIRYTYYSESEKILGNTYGMCVLQDFEAITPNLLARTIETVQGGGIIVLLLKTITSLKQLYTMSMDSHARYRTSTRFDTVNRFNERFLLSLTTNANCLVLTDSLDVVPFSQYSLKIDPIERNETDDLGKMIRVTAEQAELDTLKSQYATKYEAASGKGPIAIEAPLMGLTRTLDQAKALQSYLTSLNNSGNVLLGSRNVVSLTAGRGRGKSATMGLAIAAAVSSNISNIFITSPSPDNLKTLFEFVLKGLEALGYTEQVDYDLVQSTNPDFAKAIVRINIHRSVSGSNQQHRQTILYVAPGDSHLLGQAELVVIDEAAAIPLPLVQSLISGPHMSWMASTINGYEGTGRSLSLKLLSTLRESSGSSLKELKLDEPIRYSSGDPVEKWLNSLLCLDIPLTVKNLAGQCPHPEACDLYALNRDTLFSFHKASEAFLQRMMTLYVASHYKNSPNDLQLMSDAPAHKLFVLLPPMDTASSGLPEILAVVQVALEGSLSRQVILNSFARGKREAGDLIPWTVSQQFQEDEFASLSGARVVRIAVHPEMQGMGYGSRALQLLERFYKGELISPNQDDLEDDPEDLQKNETSNDVISGNNDLMNEVIKPRAQLKPLLTKVCDLRPPRLDWIGVSFGLTSSLFKFYRRLQYLPVYLRQTTNDITGEHSAIMLKSLVGDATWLNEFNEDFKRRFVALCGYQFKNLSITLSMNILEPGKENVATPNKSQVVSSVSPYDLKRLESYANNMLDYHMILDLVPGLARAFFLKQLPKLESSNSSTEEQGMTLSPVQAAILFSIGLQFRPIEDLDGELKLPASQVLAMFIKVIRKFATLYRASRLSQIAAAEETNNLAEKRSATAMLESLEPCAESLDDDLDEGGKKAISALKEQQRAMIDSLPLTQFAIQGESSSAAWSEELTRKSSKLSQTVISVPRPNSESSKSTSKELYEKYVAVDNNVPTNPKKKKPKTSKKN